MDCEDIKPVNPKGNQPWIFIWNIDAEVEAPVLWPHDVRSGKDPDAGKDGGQEEKGMTEDEMVGWHHRLDGHEFEWTPGVGDGQGCLVCCSPWGCKESNRTEWLNNKAAPMIRRLDTSRNFPPHSKMPSFSLRLKPGNTIKF